MGFIKSSIEIMLKKAAIYLFLFLFICSCNSLSKKDGTAILAAKECKKIKSFIHKEKLTPEEALQAMLAYYKNESLAIEGLEYSDILRFSYGPKEKEYELKFFRQLVNPENGAEFRINLVLLYELDIFGSLLKYENWSFDNPDLETWADGCRKSKGFDYATRFSKPVTYILQKEKPSE